MLPIDLTKLLAVGPWGTLFDSLLEDLLRCLGTTTRDANIAIGRIPREGLDHVPVVSLVLGDLKELILAKVVVLARDGLEVLVQGAHDRFNQLVGNGRQDPEAIITL